MARILLIDDDVDLVAMNKAVLAQRGHEVVTAHSAGEAKDALRTRPDLVVLDVMMETVSTGFELARDIHRLYPDLPTVILSGVHDATGVPFRFEPDSDWLPVLKFLDKPVAPGKLATEVESILAKPKNK